MNETVSTILNRRSMRAFKPEAILPETLETILECGLHAPSGMNVQNWHFTVVQNQELLARMNRHIKEVLPSAARERYLARNNGSDDFSIFYFAPVVVFVSGEKDNSGSMVNCALATQNMCLAAESMDIGSCIIGLAALLFETPHSVDYINELEIPEGYYPLHAVSFGYKGMEMPKPPREAGKVNVIR